MGLLKLLEQRHGVKLGLDFASLATPSEAAQGSGGAQGSTESPAREPAAPDLLTVHTPGETILVPSKTVNEVLVERGFFDSADDCSKSIKKTALPCPDGAVIAKWQVQRTRFKNRQQEWCYAHCVEGSTSMWLTLKKEFAPEAWLAKSRQ